MESDDVKRLVSDVVDLLFRFIPEERHAAAREALRLYVEEHT